MLGLTQFGNDIMDQITAKLRRRIITRLVKDWVTKYPSEWETLKQYNQFNRESAKNDWREVGGDDITISHFGDIPKKLMDDIDDIIGFETPFLDDFDERDWFAKTFPLFLARKAAGAIAVQQTGVKLRGEAK